jgi:hypothetical protein
VTQINLFKNDPDAYEAPAGAILFMFLVQEHPTFALLVMRVMADRWLP